MIKQSQQIIAVIGPTASGKSDFAVELALQHNGEIISADSRQIYRGLDIGTGKITKEEMQNVPHHMLDICDIGDDFSVAEYRRLATPIIENIISRNKTPIICGGTGQYIDAIIYNQEIPPVLPNKKLRQELENRNIEELYNELLLKDIRRAQSIDKHNKVRIIRALEIVDSLGEVPPLQAPSFNFSTKIYLLAPSRKLLKERITKRLISRLNIGMINETRDLLKNVEKIYGNTDESIMRKFGLEYVTIAKYLSKEITEDEMKQEIINKSMQYAKRQETWNKKYLPFAEIITNPENRT